MDSLLRSFVQARLPLEVLGSPIQEANRDIFQMDIVRDARETFRLWPGHATNRIEVPSADRDWSQLVLTVEEASRTYEIKLPKRVNSRRWALDIAGRNRGRIVKETASNWILSCRTEAAERRYLCGLDERHLFIAQFKEGSSVQEAHESLKPGAVREYEASGLDGTLRQGEWFFVRIGAGEEKSLCRELCSPSVRIERGSVIGGRGHPHVADKLVRLDREHVYARGDVRHVDHATLFLDSWRRVFRNAEILSADLGGNGVFWID